MNLVDGALVSIAGIGARGELQKIACENALHLVFEAGRIRQLQRHGKRIALIVCCANGLACDFNFSHQMLLLLSFVR